MTILLIAQALFWFGAGGILYVYIGYPILVLLVSRGFPKKTLRKEYEPGVSVIVAAHNEERDIRAKLENTLSLDYSPGKLEIIVASDCSTDATDEIVEGFVGRGVKLYRQDIRRGKTSAQNAAVEKARGEIVLFSDATTMYERNVLQEIVPNFADEKVGCVAGKLIYVDTSSSSIGDGAKRYWNYESFLKSIESRACSLIGTSGCLYAVRKSAYVPMYPEACSDFLIATVMYRQGLRTVYEPNAVCSEETNHQSRKELQMRVRVISQTFNDLWRNRDMLNPLKSGFYGIQLISHKLLRYFAPWFFLLVFISSAKLAANSVVFASIFVFQIIVLGLACIAWLVEPKVKRIGLLAIPFYFMLTNLSSVIGLYKFLRGERYAQWEPFRAPSDSKT